MKYNRVNNLVGWIACTIACTVYLMTMEPTASLWDTGEFISAADKLQIPHPPGAPLFTLLGRFFIILFGDDPSSAARAVNCMSALASGFTILFLFWSITHFARKVVQKDRQQLDNQQLFTIMTAGLVGALGYTFSDSFWFSAVEGEVYALSSLFTAIVFWAILKWEHEVCLELHSNKSTGNKFSSADRWLLFIFYMMGLSIGIHLLNLLTIPAIVMVYYFRRFKVTRRGTILAFLAGCAITGFVQKFVIQYTVKGAGWFDIYFVNDLGMPFFVGFTFFFLLIAALIIGGIRFAIKRNRHYLKLGLLSFAFILIGYSTYFTTMIRSNANPAVDMFNVDNPVNLSGYLSREQYGDWPLLYGPDFTDQAPIVDGGDLYVRGAKKYEKAGKIAKQDWANTPSSHFFPRMWDNGNERQQINCYQQFTGLTPDETPTAADNLKYFVNYQAGWMYMRYFMWNFAGRQNDLQGFGNARDSNWISGIPFMDNTLYGDQSKLPESIHSHNKAYNRLYMLPLLLGVLGLILQYRRNRKDFIVNMLLFFFTGLAIVLYLNQSGFQPRERDYAYVGSFYSFAIWIGLGMIKVKEMFETFLKSPAANYIAACLCLLAVPVLMARQEWDDHDRSQKTLARDLAKDYLESCPPNAILFSFEDNDTYPLWYAQEVEGIRPDVRVVISTLSGTDWLMNQLRYKINQSAPFDIIFTTQQIQGNNRNVVYYSNLPGFDQNKYYDLYGMLKNVIGSDDPRYTAQLENGESVNLLPVRKFSIPVDLTTVRNNGTVHEGDKVAGELRLDLSSHNYLLKKDLTLLAVIAANKWKRPICFTSTSELRNIGLEKYTRLEGLAYRLVPIENGNVNNDTAYRNIMQKFEYGNADKRGVYFDEENRRRLNIIRLAHAQVAISLAEAGKKEEARKILHHFDQQVSESNLPYGMASNRGNLHDGISTEFLRACYLSGDFNLAKKVAASIDKDLRQQMRYYQSLGNGDTNDETLAGNAYLLLQGKAYDLSDGQVPFASDILSTVQLLHQIEE